jgi:hypothetical protein
MYMNIKEIVKKLLVLSTLLLAPGTVSANQSAKSSRRAEFQNRMKIKYPDAELFFSVERASAKFFDQ